MLKKYKKDGHKLLITFQIYIHHKVLEILENGVLCSKEPLKIFSVLITRQIVALLKPT
jgi:hypothetical protein